MSPVLVAGVALAGAAGAVARYLVSQAFVARATAGGAPGVPIGTVVVNLLGALAAGFLAGWTAAGGGFALQWVVAVGFLGAFTTFSAWMVEVVDLWEDGRERAAALHLLGSVVGGVFLAALGFWLGALA